jgi:methionyl-tRNA synthetase
MWNKLREKGDIYKKTYKGLYCVGHEAFITQKDLVNGKCADHMTEPEVIEEENYFFRLSKYSGDIVRRIKKGELEIVPRIREHEILSFLEGDVDDVSFSRSRQSLTWGIPVPGDETQTIYVWCDALTNYLSAIGYGRNDDYRNWWPADVQVIGKDILRFHAAIWPAMLISAGLQLPKKLFVHGFITVEGQKMSKTVGNIIEPENLVKKYGVDAVRYYLLKEIPSCDDGDFSSKRFEAVYNSDLANGLGNFASRVLTLGAGEDKFSSNLPVENEVSAHIQNTKAAVLKKIDEFRLNEALSSILDLVRFGDAYINRMAPWDIEDFVKRSEIIFNLVVVLDNVAAFLEPFLPGTSEKIAAHIEWQDHVLKVKKGEVLFPRLR